jgi:hypothetical protein
MDKGWCAGLRMDDDGAVARMDTDGMVVECRCQDG